MGVHITHQMADNSLAAFASLDLSAREALVLSVYLLANAPLTDREAMERLGQTDPNTTRPRVTSLVGKSMLWECGSTLCQATGRRVRACMPTSLARKGKA